MTILEVAASSRLGGVETYLLRLAPHLRQNGHRVLFVTRRDVPLARELRKRDFEVHDWFRGGKNPLTVLRLARLIRAQRVDLVHTHIFSANSLGAMAARLAGVPSVARVPATESIEHYRRSTYVTAVSHNVAHYMAAQVFPRPTLRVFYNGVDWRRFDNLPNQAVARQQFRLPQGAFVVLCAASLTARKGQKFLLEAAASLPFDLHLLLCGEGKEEAHLRALAMELQLQNRVHFAGFVSDIRSALAASDAFVLPSLHEGLPNSVLESLAARVPTIATAVAGTPEIITDGETGFLVPPGEVEPLRNTLKKLHNDNALCRTLAQNGRQHIENRFDGDKCLDDVQQFFEEVVRAWKDGRRVLSASEAKG